MPKLIITHGEHTQEVLRLGTNPTVHISIAIVSQSINKTDAHTGHTSSRDATEIVPVTGYTRCPT